jgi:hypothetical protein
MTCPGGASGDNAGVCFPAFLYGREPIWSLTECCIRSKAGAAKGLDLVLNTV